MRDVRSKKDFSVDSCARVVVDIVHLLRGGGGLVLTLIALPGGKRTGGRDTI